MASMLSVVSGAFSSQQRAPSTVTDSEDDEPNQLEEKNGSDVDSDNPWNEDNLNKSKVKAPKEKLKLLFKSRRDGAIRDEIEIKVNTKKWEEIHGKHHTAGDQTQDLHRSTELSKS